MIKSTGAGVEIDVRVIPRARRTELAGERDGRLLVRLAAPPVEGAANEALVRFFAEWLDRPRGAVRLISGDRGRQKRIAVDGVTAAAVLDRLSGRRAG